MESKNNNNLPLSLPEELILQILLRLPVKSLVRFKCVSKSWLSLISDPNFAKSHFELAAAPTHRLLYITRPGFEAQSIDIDASLHDDSAAVSLVSPIPKSYFHGVYGFEILGSCRGFIHLGRHPNMFLWNPSTGFHRRLSFSDVGLEFFNSYNYMHLYGFGYDAATDDYLVVVAWIEYGHIDVDLATHLEIFSVRTNSWKEIEGAHIPYMYPSNQSGLLFNGAIHWLAFHDYKSVKVIIAFDLMEKNLSEISLPDGDFTDGLFGNLRMMGGCLSLCYWGNHKTEMWVMKEYKVQSSWTKFEIPTSYLSPICFAKGGELVAMSFAQLMKFNDKGELLEHRTYFDDPDGCKAAMYIESLLSLPSDFGESM